MKYCISGRHQKASLLKADEIKLKWQDKNVIFDYISDYPNAGIVLEIPRSPGEVINWELMVAWSEKLNGNFVLCLEDIAYAEVCKEFGLKFYWKYPVSTYFELNGVIAAGASEALLGMPLSFDLAQVRKVCGSNFKLRMVANLAYEPYLPRENGIHGQWIRPEDVKVYDRYIDVIEFRCEHLTQEATMLHVYKENGYWPGNLNLLITNLNKDVDNRGIPEEIGEKRAVCGQRCERNGVCSFCDRSIEFSRAVDKYVHEQKKVRN